MFEIWGGEGWKILIGKHLNITKMRTSPIQMTVICFRGFSPFFSVFTRLRSDQPLQHVFSGEPYHNFLTGIYFIFFFFYFLKLDSFKCYRLHGLKYVLILHLCIWGGGRKYRWLGKLASFSWKICEKLCVSS